MNNDEQFAIILSDISKRYQLTHEKPTLSEKLIFRKKTSSHTALRNINLKIKKGEKVGIVGSNGAGKTTLLKIISGITTPTSGTLITNGKISSLIDPSAGFHPELSGLENIFLNGLLLGMKRYEINKHLDDIVAFAGIGKFIDTPFFTYSEGMKLRLGFSVALHSEPDIFLIDESIFAGDITFQTKIREKIETFIEGGNTFLLVSHVLRFVEEMCERVVVLNKGKVLDDGGLDLLQKYKNTN